MDRLESLRLEIEQIREQLVCVNKEATPLELPPEELKQIRRQMICNDLRETALPELRKKYPGKSDDEAIEMEYDRLIKIQEAYLEDMR